MEKWSDKVFFLGANAAKKKMGNEATKWFIEELTLKKRKLEMKRQSGL